MGNMGRAQWERRLNIAWSFSVFFTEQKGFFRKSVNSWWKGGCVFAALNTGTKTVCVNLHWSSEAMISYSQGAIDIYPDSTVIRSFSIRQILFAEVFKKQKKLFVSHKLWSRSCWDQCSDKKIWQHFEYSKRKLVKAESFNGVNEAVIGSACCSPSCFPRGTPPDSGAGRHR